MRNTKSSGEKGLGTDRPSALAGKIASNPASRQQSRRIALVDIGGRLPIDLQGVATKLNRLQTGLFLFQVVTPPITNLGTYDLLHYFSDQRLFSFIKGRIEGSDFRFGIGVTHETLDKDRFNRHTEKEGVGVVTVDDAEKYKPLGKSLEKYLCFLILCEAFCVAGGEHFEHDERRFCLFDMCLKKDDLVTCLARPHICPDCEERLENAGFSAQDIERAKQVLTYVGGTSPWDVFKEIVFTNPIVWFLIGGLSLGILSQYIANFPTGWVRGIQGFLLVVFLVYMWIRYRQAQPRL